MIHKPDIPSSMSRAEMREACVAAAEYFKHRAENLRLTPDEIADGAIATYQCVMIILMYGVNIQAHLIKLLEAELAQMS